MRIIAGKNKGKKLTEFQLSTTRPTSDLIKGAIFDKLGFGVVDSVFLDLFAGTGAVGIEAISRGAKQVIFVDQNFDAIKIINKNLASINNKDSVVLRKNYAESLEILSTEKKLFDIVFLDPPYASDFAEKAIDTLKAKNMLSQNAVIVWEHDQSKLDYIASHFKNYNQKKYGAKYVTYINFEV